MDVLWIPENGGPRPENAAQLAASKGFFWIDASAEEVAPAPEDWRARIEQLTGVHLHDLHLQDAVNPAHPSYFENTLTYEMVVFRRIVADPPSDAPAPGGRKPAIPLMANLRTRPVAFFVLPQALISVRHGASTTCEAMKRRLAEQRGERLPEGRVERLQSTIGPLTRPLSGPAELMLRLLNGMVDKYLALRQPLTLHLDRWQRELLNPSGRFHNWLALLDVRIVLRRLESICEEQYDALSELRDAAMDLDEDARGSGAFDQRRDALLVRINDVMEHVNRVLNHARRMESSVENAVQLHFSATAHRTNQIMRILTVVTVIFTPLTLITGIFGMNFDHLPLVHERGGFWWLLAGMALLAALLWTWFSARRYIETRPYRVAEALARKAGWRAGRQEDDPTERL
ncbi:magnesium transporter CorA family protein [Pigmentiphaga sp.]|uniref:magnesium transporter CorA family protein n=1 Tax=Pigmentiphaga sp. TaxID=1977564 RepID=UPI0025F2ED63|nr:magnesium transporter CorA family protein [Pigmentiphaga sp.]MBX6318146.1 magnesium transporter CorA family protein [Pigmentiphaga sp.]